MKTILLVFGTRPEAIKMCPLVNELKARPDTFKTIVCVSGQHREMLDQVLEVFDVVPDFDLSIMKPNQTLSSITASVLSGIEEVISMVEPDIVLVHGDTTTSFAAALAAFYHQVPIGHVEAGLRTNNLYSPWPEEFNRQAVDIVSKWHFAPTEKAKENLLHEGKGSASIFVTGNTGIDSLKTTISKASDIELYDWIGNDRLILITAHRRENLGEPMHNMFRAIRRILDKRSDVKAVYPIHMNPKVRAIANEEFAGCNRLRIIDPLEVVAFHALLNKSYLVLTDSGGIQEEAPSLGKPVLVMRDTTERPEGVAAGTLKLVGTDETRLHDAISELLDDEQAYKAMSHAQNPYGDGRASERIADILEGKDPAPLA